MNELERVLIGASAAAPAANIFDGVGGELAHREIAGSPRTIYEEVWHIAFWQQITHEWIDEVETPYPEHDSAGFPVQDQIKNESWDALRLRFFAGLQSAANAVRDSARLERIIRCPSAPGKPMRTMTVREQLESLAAHNAYHFGRIVLMRQIAGAWPPPSGGDSW